MAEEAMTSETWREVDGYGGIYEVSTLGRVRSVDRVLADGRNIRGVILAQNKVGPTRRYLAVHLYDNGGRRTAARVNRLVALAFIGQQPEGSPEVRHLNGDSFDNNVRNLAWGTRSDNMRDLVAHGHHAMQNRTHCPQGHEYTPETTYRKPKQNARRCRICRREQARLAHLRKTNQ